MKKESEKLADDIRFLIDDLGDIQEMTGNWSQVELRIYKQLLKNTLDYAMAIVEEHTIADRPIIPYEPDSDFKHDEKKLIEWLDKKGE